MRCVGDVAHSLRLRTDLNLTESEIWKLISPYEVDYDFSYSSYRVSEEVVAEIIGNAERMKQIVRRGGIGVPPTNPEIIF